VVDLRPLRVDGRDVGAILAFCRGAAAPGGRTGEGGVPESKDEIARAREQIEELRWELARSERLQALGEFVTVIVHDLNNVFASVASALRLIGRASGQGALFALASEGTNVLDRGARLVRQMHDFARGSSEDAAPISASVALDRLSGLIRSLAGPAIVVEIGAAEDVGTIWTSSNRLDSVILGLTANALEAMPAGGRLEISARNADASDLPLGLPVGPFMRLDFVHTGGAGSPEAAYDALRPTPKRRGRGAGLGLASVFRFAAETGGRCVVTSAVGGSIEVTLFLPRGTAFTAHGMDSDAESAEAGEV
jgi:signal transduction histidine kinase